MKKKSWLTQLSYYITFQRIKKVTEYVHDVMHGCMQPALTATLQAAISWRDVQCPVAHAFCYKLLGITCHVFDDLAHAPHIGHESD